jgi:hypothetical protein
MVHDPVIAGYIVRGIIPYTASQLYCLFFPELLPLKTRQNCKIKSDACDNDKN